MKKLLSIILMASMIVTLTPIACGGALTQSTAFAEDSTYTYTATGLIYILHSDGTNHTATLVDSTSELSTLTIPTKVTANNIEYTVTAIDTTESAGCNIKQNDKLTSVTIPSTVTSIGEDVFLGCQKLTSITVEAGNTNFSADNGVLFNNDKTKLIKCGGGKSGDYTIPNSVTSIGKQAFANCFSLTSVTIPEGVTSIGEGAFYYCPKLTSVTIPKTVTSIGDKAFMWCCQSWKEDTASRKLSITIASDINLKAIGKYVFADTRIEKITIPASVESIGAWAFAGCDLLTSIAIPEGVKSIGANVFYDCDILETVSIPKTVTTLGERAFANCEKLTNVTIDSDNSAFCSENGAIYNKNKTKLISVYDMSKYGEYEVLAGVTTIAKYAFDNCKKIGKIKIPSSVTNIEAGAFKYNCEWLTTIEVASDNGSYSSSSDGVLFDKNKTTIVFHPMGITDERYTIPTGVTTIGSGAFYNNTNLRAVTIPDGVTRIEDEAFCRCNKILTIEIPKGVTSIGSSAFEDCDSVEAIEVPDGVTSIGNRAFASCSNLKEVTIPASVTSMASNVFESSSIEKITFGGTKEQWDRLNVTLPTSENTQIPGGTAKKAEVVYQTTTPTPEPTPVHYSGGGSSIQKPTVVTPTNGKITILPDGKTAVIIPDDGYEVASVILNGEDKGTFPVLMNLKSNDKVEATFQKTKETLDTETKAAVASLITLKARSSKTAKGNVKVIAKLSTAEKAKLAELTSQGYTVKYRFYRSTKKSSGYKAMLEGTTGTYYNTSGESGTRYYYKARVMVYDAQGNLIAKSTLKQCKYAARFLSITPAALF